MAINFVKQYREDLDITVGELSRRVSAIKGEPVSRVTLSMYETGRANPSIDNAYALCKVFGIKLDDLFGEGGLNG